MKNTFRTVTKIWAELYNVSTGQTWAATYTDENNVEHTLIPADTVRYYFYYKYGDFYCEYMHSKWQMYNTLQAADLYRALQAWNADYNPQFRRAGNPRQTDEQRRHEHDPRERPRPQHSDHGGTNWHGEFALYDDRRQRHGTP